MIKEGLNFQSNNIALFKQCLIGTIYNNNICCTSYYKGYFSEAQNWQNFYFSSFENGWLVYRLVLCLHSRKFTSIIQVFGIV